MSKKKIIQKAINDLEEEAISGLEFNQITSKAKIDTGTRCNASCYFCYYRESLQDPVKSFDSIIEEIDQLLLAGFTKIELSGGEPTIHPDFIKILEYISNKGAEPSFLTNAIAIDSKMMQEIYTAGVRDILISIQGTENHHNKILGSTENNAFQHIFEVIDWMQHLDMQVRVNTVVADNLNDLPQLWLKLKDKINTWNLLPLNHWGDAGVLKRMPYQEAGMMFGTLLRNRAQNDPKINIRYFPRCFIEESYRDSVLNYYEQYSDLEDWHPFFMQSRDFNSVRLKAARLNTTSYYKKDLLNKRKKFFVKDIDCLKCSMFNECDGYKK